MSRATRFAVVLALLLGLLGAAWPAKAELPLVNGPVWNASTKAEKRAYLIGVANTLALREAVAAKKQGADPSASLNRMNSALSMKTIDNGIARIDAWYKANPSRADLPVLGVIYLGMVKGE